ncbi:hypothetical protein Ocin01_16042 [Orchesella cincta]|uniref:Uncharacterized protein n=1 Tax=Orchesella cincta TaxID=48709 RepID=A0A1D2MCD8_ORCCI|nr:hypothetical protein Ocin01_16042 [Orchesella cincta]
MPATTQWYYKDEGRAVPAANTLLNLTVKFMPYGYQAEHCLALRVAGVVKMHELAEKVKDERVENSVVEEFVHATYFRSEVFVKKPLYEIIPLNMTQSEHANLQTFEFKALCNVYESLARFYGIYEEWMQPPLPAQVHHLHGRQKPYPPCQN